jgi:hypothetical protein
VSSEEAERSTTKGRKENKKPDSPKRKKHRRQRTVTLSDDPSTHEVEGGTDLKVGRHGAGKFKVTISRVARK